MSVIQVTKVLVLRAPANVGMARPGGRSGPSPPRWFVIGGAGEGRNHLGYACSAQTNCGKFEPRSIYPPFLGPPVFQVNTNIPKARALKSLNESGTPPTLAATRSAK